MDAYLRRIGAERPRRADHAALRELQERHLLAVPFENLSVHLGEEIVLEEKALLAKVVEGGRGGFCYELGGAFAALLRDVGFTVSLLQARVHDGAGGIGIPYDHLALLVETEAGTAGTVEPGAGGRWLVDVGFGENSRHPLDFDARGDQPDPAGTFRIVETEHGDLDLYRDGKPQYRMETRPRVLEDFRAGARWHSTAPESPFLKSLVCSKLTADGRITLSGSKLVRTGPGGRREEPLADDAAVLAAYRDHFGLRLDRLPPDPRAGRGRAEV
ncbi:arylamine N-acetyltransferase [Streptomyces sp. NPDC014894]|uniref:arylamine N-acetyltransferase family protein n=1 Tax=Streptomyces sp. NPDC014894 TaxID=3364931 RepID=UPI0036F6EA73